MIDTPFHFIVAITPAVNSHKRRYFVTYVTPSEELRLVEVWASHGAEAVTRTIAYIINDIFSAYRPSPETFKLIAVDQIEFSPTRGPRVGKVKQ